MFLHSTKNMEREQRVRQNQQKRLEVAHPDFSCSSIGCATLCESRSHTSIQKKNPAITAFTFLFHQSKDELNHLLVERSLQRSDWEKEALKRWIDESLQVTKYRIQGADISCYATLCARCLRGTPF